MKDESFLSLECRASRHGRILGSRCSAALPIISSVSLPLTERPRVRRMCSPFPCPWTASLRISRNPPQERLHFTAPKLRRDFSSRYLSTWSFIHALIPYLSPWGGALRGASQPTTCAALAPRLIWSSASLSPMSGYRIRKKISAPRCMYTVPAKSAGSQHAARCTLPQNVSRAPTVRPHPPPSHPQSFNQAFLRNQVPPFH